MKIVKSREIVIEIEKTRVVQYKPQTFSYCRACDAASEFVLAPTAATILDSSIDKIIRRVAAGKLHAADAATTETFQICLNSVLSF